MQTVRRALASQSVTGVADAAVTSVLSLIVVLIAARAGGTETVGQLALASTVVLLSLGFFRMVVGLPTLAELPPPGPDSRTRILTQGIMFAALVASGATIIAVSTRSWLPLLIGAWGSLAVLQDAQRYASMLEARYRALLLLDALLVGASTAVLLAASSAEQMILGLCAGLVAALIGGMLALRPWSRVHVGAAFSHWRANLMVRAWPLALDGAVYTVSVQGSLWIVASRASIPEVGELRLAMLFAFPFSVLMAGLTNRLVQRTSQKAAVDRRPLAFKLAAILGVLGAVVGIVLSLAAPFIIGAAEARGLVIPLTAVLLTLLGSALLLASLPLFSLAVAEGRIVAIAFVRGVAGIVLLALVGATSLGLSASGAAAATAVSSVALLLGIVALTVRGSAGSTRAQGVVPHES